MESFGKSLILERWLGEISCLVDLVILDLVFDSFLGSDCSRRHQCLSEKEDEYLSQLCSI